MNQANHSFSRDIYIAIYGKQWATKDELSYLILLHEQHILHVTVQSPKQGLGTKLLMMRWDEGKKEPFN